MTTATESTTLQQAIRTLGAYTAGRFDIWLLAGPAKASCRAHVMSDLLGVRTPQSKSGVFAIRAEFYRQAGIAGGCEAQREESFREFCRSL